MLVGTQWRSWLRHSYKPKGRGFDSWWCHWDFLLKSSRPGVDSASNRNEYQEYLLECKGGRYVGLTLSPSCADCHEIRKPQPPGTLKPAQACTGLVLPFASNMLCWNCTTHLLRAGTYNTCKIKQKTGGKKKNATARTCTHFCINKAPYVWKEV